MNLTNIRKLISKLNKEDKIVRVWSKKKPELLEDLKKVQYQLDEEKQQLTPTVQMKRKRIIKLTDSKTDKKKMPLKKTEETKKLSPEDMKKLKEHSKSHEGGMKGKHMKSMIKSMKEGDSFKQAHEKAKKEDEK